VTERFAAGLVGAPFGVDGRVKIKSFSGEGAHLLRLEKVLLRKGGAEEEYAVEGVFSQPLSLKLAGINSPEAAKTLSGAEIIVSRMEAAPLNEGEFYIEDLKGLKVFAAGGLVGEILDLVEGGGGFLVEVGLIRGGKRLVPFRNEFFGAVDLAAGRMELRKSWILE
jgi:16S rRNA processing protein RimM